MGGCKGVNVSDRCPTPKRNCSSPNPACPKGQAHRSAALRPRPSYAPIPKWSFRAKRSLEPEKAELLRQIPSVDELLRQPRMAKLAGRIPANCW